MGLIYLNSPQCVWELSLVWHLQVWWFPQLGKEPRMNAKNTVFNNNSLNSTKVRYLLRLRWRGIVKVSNVWHNNHLYHIGELLADQGHDERRLPHFGCRGRKREDERVTWDWIFGGCQHRLLIFAYKLITIHHNIVAVGTSFITV